MAEGCAVSEDLEPYFRPPEGLIDVAGGAYRSPLLFNDGSRVENAAQWTRRREEIRTQWLEALGPLPSVPDRPLYRVLKVEHREHFELRKLRYRIQTDWEESAYLLLPPGKNLPGAVIVYYEPETAIGFRGKRTHFAKDLAELGVATISIGLNRLEFPLNSKPFCQPLIFRAALARLAYRILAAQEQVDGGRIGIMGHSFGGKWALFASCLIDEFCCAVWSDPGCVFDETRANCNWWDPWYLGYEPSVLFRHQGAPRESGVAYGGYRALVQAGRDLTDLHALMAPRPFLLSGGSEDPAERWKALVSSIEVNRLLGYEHRVAMTTRATHVQTEESLSLAYRIFKYMLASNR